MVRKKALYGYIEFCNQDAVMEFSVLSTDLGFFEASI